MSTCKKYCQYFKCYNSTGWSLKTVNCNFFLTDPKISRSAITQWFLESLYREVLVFWCFKIVRCVNFAFWSFSDKEHLLHHSRPYHSYTFLDAFKPNKHTYTSLKCSQTPPSGFSGHFRTTTDTNRHQTTPTDTKQHQQTLPDTQKGCSRMCGCLCWHQMSFAGVCWCLMTSFTVLCCLQMLKGCLRNFSRGIWVLSGFN